MANNEPKVGNGYLFAPRVWPDNSLRDLLPRVKSQFRDFENSIIESVNFLALPFRWVDTNQSWI